MPLELREFGASGYRSLTRIAYPVSDLEVFVGGNGVGKIPGARLVIEEPVGRDVSFALRFPEFPKRDFEATELSDGTLRYLALAGALLAYRLPPFIALNEPEASLHPSLLGPLADMVVRAARKSQILLVTHSATLAEAIAATGAAKIRTVEKRDGATCIAGLSLWGEFRDDDLEHE
jgi:predicted ATPase